MINYKGFIEYYFKIKDKAGNVVPFIFNNVQNKYYDILKKEYSTLRGIRENILKARKEGFSSLVAGIFTTDFILSGLKNCILNGFRRLLSCLMQVLILLC